MLNGIKQDQLVADYMRRRWLLDDSLRPVGLYKHALENIATHYSQYQALHKWRKGFRAALSSKPDDKK